MFFQGALHDDNVIEINQAGLARKSSEDCFHKALKSCRCIAQAKRHNLKLPQFLSRGEGSSLYRQGGVLPSNIRSGDLG
ncbi:hypothetical protein TNCV_513791 [Trichonephila clavipes]|nr:hypothetical protein TNCV_513791 [Trichonephila clavipes]